MALHRKKYTREFKIDMVEKVLSGQSMVKLAKNNEVSPGLIVRWKRQYLDGKFHGSSINDQELRKLEIDVNSYIHNF
ncbi:MAG: hypothetical protein E3J77_02220 [Actinobacteria bacterium]|nr:MAG: hypothetical protein E3J77_02220 [Actinomycetota bacterium]